MKDFPSTKMRSALFPSSLAIPLRWCITVSAIVVSMCFSHAAFSQQSCGTSISTNGTAWYEGDFGENVRITGEIGPSGGEVESHVSAHSSDLFCPPGSTQCVVTQTGTCEINAAVSWSIQFINSGGSNVNISAGASCNFKGKCAPGYILSNGSCALVEPALQNCTTQPKPSKTRGKPRIGACHEGNPCDVATGNKYEREVDYAPTSPDGLSYVRYYNSDTFTPAGRLGLNWRDEFDRQLLFTDMKPVAKIAYRPIQALVYRPDGKIITFNINGSTFTAADPDTVETLSQVNADTWAFTTADDTVETYHKLFVGNDPIIQLQSIRFRTGVTLSLTWSGLNLATVTDSFGHSLAFAYDPNTGRLSSVTDPSGNVYFYNYNGTNYSFSYLSDVYYPGPTQGSTTGAPHRQYLYADAANPGALTNIVDESSATYASWGYDNQRRAILSSHGNAQDQYTFTYNADGTTTVTEGGGGSRVYTFGLYNTVPKYTSIVQGSLTQSATYDTSGYPTSQIDRNGNKTTFQFDARGLENSRTEGLTSGGATTGRTRTIATQWHPAFHLPSSISVYAGATATGTALRTTSFTYDGSGNMLTRTITDPATSTSRTWTHTYNSFGRVLTIDGPRTDVTDLTTFTYYNCATGSQCGQINTITNAAGQVTTYNTYNARGQPLTITDPNGVVTTLTYDVQQRLKTRTVSGETTTLDYFPTGLLQKITLADASFIQYTYDTAHRLTDITDSAGNKVHYTLDTIGNRTAENSYDPSNALHRTHTRVFNGLNQLYQDINAAGTINVTTTFAYDGNGNPSTINAPLSRNTTNAYDELNRLKQITDPGNGITQLSYDATDNLLTVTDPRTLVTTYTYNGIGDLKTQTSPDTGLTTNTYDSGGNLKTATDARSAVATYSYDALNRLTQILFTDQTITLGYDAGTNGKGRLTSASDASHSMSWTYDALGRVTGKGQTIGTLTKSIGYGYTSGNLSSIVTPSGQTITYGYNSNHQVTSIAVNGTTVLSAVTYEPFGPVKSWTWGNGTTMNRGYDTDGRVTSIASGGMLSLSPISYDDASRVTGITDTQTSANSWTYGYDALDRLTSAVQTGGTYGWTYDANGNRLTQTGTSASTYTVSSTSNRVNSISGALPRTYTYDAAGNAKTWSNITLTYNKRGRESSAVVGTTTTNYTYNAVGQLIKKSGGINALLMYDEEGHLMGEYTTAGALTQETVWLGDIPVATLRPNGSTACTSALCIFYVHADQVNSPIRVSRPSPSTLAWRWDTPPFGTGTPNQNPGGLGSFIYNLRFPGQVADSQTQLRQNWFRDYDPAIGRYAQSDPIGLAGGVNTFAYAGQNPIYYFDPYGLWAWGDPLPQGLVDGVTGFGDGINIFGFSPSRAIRGGWDIDGGVSKCSPEYLASKDAGEWYSTLFPAAGRLGYISRVATIPRSVTTVESAYAAREAIKGEYRSILRPVFNAIGRDPTLADVLAKAAAKGDAYAIARAGVANSKWSMGIFGASAAGAIRQGFSDGCGCQK